MKKIITSLLAGIAVIGGSWLGATGALSVKADEAVAVNQASVTINGETTEYATAEKAFESLRSDGTGYATVTLLTDVTLTSGLSTVSNERTTVDLNGKKVSGGHFLFYGKDTLKDSSEAGTGTVEMGLEVRTGAALTVKSGHIYGDYPIYLRENATAILAGGSFYGYRDAFVSEGATLLLKNAEFPAVDGKNGGFDFFNNTQSAKGFAEFLDVSAAYYMGESKVADATTVATNEATSVKQQYVATYKQEGKETVYITDVASIKNAIFSTGYDGEQDFSSVDNSLPTTITLYADAVSTSLIQELKNLTIDLNGNVMTDATHRVETTLHLTDSSTYQMGLLDNGSFMLNEWGNATSEVTITLDCNSYNLNVYVYQYGKFTVTDGQHYGRFGVSVNANATSAQVSLHGGTYEKLVANGITKAEGVQFSVKEIAVVGNSSNPTWDIGYYEEDCTLGEALADGYKLQYADGTYEKDLTKQTIYGSFAVVAHEHSYAENYNEEKHWKECACGLIEEGSEAEHSDSTGVFSKDETAHWSLCSCGAQFSYEEHGHEVVLDLHTDENGHDEHKVACGVCDYESTEECTLDFVEEQAATETAMGSRTYKCDCGYTKTEAYCDHLGEYTYTKVGTAEDETHQYTCAIEGCGETWTEDCDSVLVEEQSATETEMGYYTYQCECGYTKTETYCDHLGDYTYTKVGTAEDETHQYTCAIEGCGETWTEDCDPVLVEDQPATETEMGYYTYQCKCGYTKTETYCDHLGEYTYTKVGTAEDATHTYICKIEGCGETLTEDCYFERETVYPTDTVDGYYVHTCGCGYTYNEYSDEVKAFGNKTMVTIGGLEMALSGNTYYVNGENGGIGTLHSEAPATYHASLTWEAAAGGEPIITLAVNGLDISVTSGSALILADSVRISVSGENTITATYGEAYATIDMLGDNVIVGGEEGGTLNVTVNASEGVEAFALSGKTLAILDAILKVKFNAIGYAVYAENDLHIEDSTVSVETNATAVKADELMLEASTLRVDVKSELLTGKTIETTDFYAYRSIVKVSVAYDEGMARAVYAEEYLYAWQSEFNVEITRLTPKTDGEAEEVVDAMAIGFSGDEFELGNSIVNVSISDINYAYGMLVDGYIDVSDSALSLEILSDGVITGLAVNEGYEGGLLIENSTVDITLKGGANGISVNAEGYTDYALKIYNSKVNVEIIGENVMTYGINVEYAPYEEGGAAMIIDHSTVTVDTSKAIAQIQYGMYAALDYNENDEVADAYGLYVKNSKVYVYYGAGIITNGIVVNYNIYEDDSSAKEGMYVRKSTVHSENQIAGDWDEETLKKYATWENAAISVSANFDESKKHRLITLDKANVTAIAGDGTVSVGFEISIKEDCCQSYIDEVLYAIDCKLKLMSGKGMMESAGLRLNAQEDIYGDFGIQLIDCETLVISGEASRIPFEDDFLDGTTAAMYLQMDTEDELLYLEGGHTVLIAPDTYKVEEDGEIVTYNKNSYALIVDGDDAEIVSGTLEMWAGTYCVDGDLDMKNALYPASSLTYDDEAIDDRFGSDIRFEDDEEDTPKYVFIGENEVYVGGLAMSEGEYYVNGKHGEVGEVYDEEIEGWNAKLEAVYDEEGEFVKYILTLNGLYLASQEDSLLFAQIWSLGDIDIVLVDGSENVVEANVLVKEYATYRTASAIDVRTWEQGEYEDEEDGETYTMYVMKKDGTVMVSGDGEWTLVGSKNGVTHDGKLYVAMDDYFENGVYTLKNLKKEVEATEGSWTVKSHTHTASDWIVEKAATCTEAGSKYTTCADCGSILERAEISATGHAHGEWTVTKEATATENGVKEKVCAVCGDKVTEEIPATGEVETPADSSSSSSTQSEKSGCSGAIAAGGFGGIALIGLAIGFLFKKKED